MYCIEYNNYNDLTVWVETLKPLGCMYGIWRECCRLLDLNTTVDKYCTV